MDAQLKANTRPAVERASIWIVSCCPTFNAGGFAVKFVMMGLLLALVACTGVTIWDPLLGTETTQPDAVRMAIEVTIK
ncbi:hypothetical protein D3C72_1925810 [compost metagenome]